MIVALPALFFAYCLLLTHLSRREWPGKDSYLANALLIGGFWAAVYAMSRPLLAMCRGYDTIVIIPLFMLLLLVGLLLAWPYGYHVAQLMMDETAKVITGANRLPPHPRFDQADKALVEKRYDDAIGRYLDSAKEVPLDPEPLRRAGEACLLAGRDVEAVGHWRRALELTTSAEDRASLGFRLAELLERRLGRPEDARELLVSLAGDLKGTRFADYAWDRHSKLPEGLRSR